MSGILDRMAQRALGTLPGIRPVTALQFAQQGWGGLESNLEVEAPRTPAARTQPAQQAGPISRFTVAEPSGPLPERKQSAHDPAPEHRAPADMEERTASGEVRVMAAASSEPVASPPRDAVSPERPQESVEVIEVLGAEAAEHPARLQPRPDRGDEAPASLVFTQRRQPAGEAQPLPPAEQKTEIHISIGSIELRAARAESKPAAPRFRPRVTLDEYLRRKPEAHS